MIYLDCAATSFQKPPQVARAAARALADASSPGRGAYGAAMKASRYMLDAREAAAELFNVSEPDNIVLTMNATHALNIAINTLARKGCKTVISGFEHNAVTRPLHAIGANVTVAGRTLFDEENVLEEFESALDGAELAVCTHVSNVFGFVLPIYQIAEMCADRGVPLIVDASQSAGILQLDCRRLRAAFIAMPGHKSLLGIPGSGLLICGERATPLLYGGSGGESIRQDMPDYLPDRLEAGTQNAPAAAALAEGIGYVLRQGTERILRHEQALCARMTRHLSGRGDVELFTPENGKSTVLSLRVKDRDCEELASALAADGICVRSGLHCAPLAHRSAGTLETGTLRMSFSPFNTSAEIDRAAAKLIKII